MSKEIPVYLFVGFLESGKTKFIQETFEDPQFDSGDKTLLLICEEGEEEYDPEKFAFGGVYPATLEDKSELTKENLEMLAKKSGCGRVVVEYNGMWMLNDLAAAMPDNWVIYQCIATADGSTFKLYANDNAMRSLLLDKVAASELIVLNRAENVNDEESREFVHKVVRQASRRCDIAYEYTDGKVVYDDIEDPLPFDLDAPVVEIEDRDFAIWYRDMSEEPKKYDGKTIEVKCRCLVRKNVPKGCFIAGRHIMTCCVQDIQFAGIICVWDRADEIRNDEWAIITARLDYKFHRAYGRKGPVFTVQSVQEVEKPEEPVATFY